MRRINYVRLEPPPRRRWRDRLAIPLMLAGALVVAGVGAWSFGAFAADNSFGPATARVSPLLPDLAMGPIRDVAVGTTDTSQQRLRFGAIIVNIGAGPFLLRGRRSWLGSNDWAIEQWFEEPGGGYSSRATAADLVYGGDSHDHWHVKFVEAHQIETLDGEVLGQLVKEGFCFFDTDPYATSLAGAPARAHWGARGCATSFDTGIRMGLSVGWSDDYPWHLLNERIDVTDVADGQYRIRQIADPNDEFEESDETNNETWVEIELRSTPEGLREVTVIEAGPLPTPSP